MPEFFQLSRTEQLGALNMAADVSARPPHLLEKDIWVVWSLRHLFTGPYAEHLVFKGGTSLSKAYGVIRRFSEDIDLTYDIRTIAGDLVGNSDAPLPASKSQGKKWSEAPAATPTSSTCGRVKLLHLAMAGRVMITRFDAPWQAAPRIL